MHMVRWISCLLHGYVVIFCCSIHRTDRSAGSIEPGAAGGGALAGLHGPNLAPRRSRWRLVSASLPSATLSGFALPDDGGEALRCCTGCLPECPSNRIPASPRLIPAYLRDGRKSYADFEVSALVQPRRDAAFGGDVQPGRLEVSPHRCQGAPCWEQTRISDAASCFAGNWKMSVAALSRFGSLDQSRSGGGLVGISDLQIRFACGGCTRSYRTDPMTPAELRRSLEVESKREASPNHRCYTGDPWLSVLRHPLSSSLGHSRTFSAGPTRLLDWEEGQLRPIGLTVSCRSAALCSTGTSQAKHHLDSRVDFLRGQVYLESFPPRSPRPRHLHDLQVVFKIASRSGRAPSLFADYLASQQQHRQQQRRRSRKAHQRGPGITAATEKGNLLRSRQKLFALPAQ